MIDMDAFGAAPTPIGSFALALMKAVSTGVLGLAKRTAEDARLSSDVISPIGSSIP
jgi:hypothetical protein